MLSIFLIIIGLGGIIIAHEFGHFIVAKRNGVRVEIFSVGFGPVLWKVQKGETEYRLSLIPLGGFVKLAGELATADHVPQPHELSAKGKWPRFKIFTAGVVMNLLLAIPLCCASFMSGRTVQEPILTKLSYEQAAAGLRPGDKITKIDNKEITDAADARITLAIDYKKGEDVTLSVNRSNENLTIKIKNSPDQLSMESTSKIGLLKDTSVLKNAGVEKGDVITSINGKLVVTHTQIISILEENIGKEVFVTLDREGKKLDKTFTVPGKTVFTIQQDFGLVQPIIGSVVYKQDGEGVLKSGDLIASIDDVSISSWQDLKTQLKGKGGKEIKVVVTRDNSNVHITHKAGSDENGNGILGITFKETPIIHSKPQSTALQNAWCVNHDNCIGLLPGDEIIQFDNVISPPSPLHVFGIYNSKESKRLQVKRNNTVHNFDVVPEEFMAADLEKLGLADQGALYFQPNSKIVYYSLFESTKLGFNEALQIISITLKSLKKLVVSEVSFKEVAGPVGIMQVLHKTSESGISDYLKILALITINLGVINLFPIPALDGGHVLLLAIEAVRRKRLSEKTIYAMHYVGYALLLCLVIVATYNDILRIFKL